MESTTFSPPLAPSSHQINHSVEDGDEFRLLVQSIKDYAIFMLSVTGHIQTWNEGAARIKGYRAEEIIGKHFSQFYPDEDIASGKPARELAIALSEGKYEEQGWRLRKDGTKFWASVVITALFGMAGNLRGFGKVTRDLTEQKIAEEALRASEERFRMMVEGVKDYSIFMLDPSGLIQTWNEGARQMKGYRAEEIIGQHFSRFYLEDDFRAGKPETELKVALAEGRFEEEGWRVRKDGSVFWANVILTSLVDAEGTLRGYAKVTRDITERKKVEEQLQSNTEELKEKNIDLARSNQELDEFAYIASHDLKEPLRGIHNYSKFLLEDYSDKLDSDGKSKLETLGRLAQKLDGLIDSLLLFSRVGRAQLAIQPTDLTDVVATALQSLQITIMEEHVDVCIQGPLPTVIGDRVRLTEVFQNLIANGIKYNDKQAKRIEIGCASSSTGNHVFYVRDNGIGIPRKHSESVFRLFKRLHARDKFGGGTGMGLTIVRKIIERHGGRIWVDSAPSDGTTFRFTLSDVNEA